MKWIARALLSVIASVLVLAVMAAGWLTWLGTRDPMVLIDREVPAYSLVSRETYSLARKGEERLFRDLTFAADGVAPIRITVSLPGGDTAARLPVLVLLGGLKSGRDSLERLPAVGQNAVLAFEYPYSSEIRDKSAFILERLRAAHGAVMETPGQLAFVLGWLRTRPWADPARVSLLGYSLGAVFVPVVNHKARRQRTPVAASIMAFGGADLGAVAANVLDLAPGILGRVVAAMVDTLVRSVEPAFHLPALAGEVLLVNAEADEMIPATSSRRMTELAPEPKTIVLLPGEHIDPRDQVVLDRIVSISGNWLKEKGVVNVMP
jgi:pimeloyl-ACP methyl ester carboxylesterase